MSDIPSDLPQAAEAQEPVDPTRSCEKCGTEEIRITSNFDGRRGFCNKCKHSWGISMAASVYIPDHLNQRGLGKRTIQEPDWNLAYEPDVDSLDPEN